MTESERSLNEIVELQDATIRFLSDKVFALEAKLKRAELRKRGVPQVLVYLTAAIYNLALFSGTAWLVFFNGESGWWFLLAMLLSASGKVPSESKEGE